MSDQEGLVNAVVDRQLQVLSVGEALVDLISDAEHASLLEARSFHMYPGGQAANVALNVARLGGKSALVARVGDDSFGLFLQHHFASSGVDVACVRATPHTPTTLVIVSRHSVTPDFTVYRGADAQMVQEDMPVALLEKTQLIHTSAFALSQEPTRSTIIDFVALAREKGCLISFDPNYHPRLWKEDDPLTVFARIAPYVTLAKPSLDDCTRLFGAGQTPEAYAKRFLELGVRNVVLTMGQGGALLVSADHVSYYSARQVQVVDITGAGDSFWSGLLLGMLDGYPLSDAVRVGLEIAAIKIQQVGPLSQRVERNPLYAQLGLKSR